MHIREVTAIHTPNSGRQIWNENDRELEARIAAFGFNVRAAPFLASGDGVNDDRAAIQSAIDTTAQKGGGTVFLPTGTYLLNGSLNLKHNVNLRGAGMRATTLRLADGANQAVITDLSAGVEGAYAFGRVHLADFKVDGNKDNNPQGKQGIYLTAYFSVFENLEVTNCRLHGIHLGFPGLQNEASQNRVQGCRVSRCNNTGIFLDNAAVDSSITDNFIHDCEYGVVIRNGGIRLINNVIYNHSKTAVQVKQTSYDTVIALNDINGNRRNAIHITRTSQPTKEPWSQILVTNNSILGNELVEDNIYDAITVETTVMEGINKVSILGNKIFTLNGPNRYRFGVNLASNVHATKCANNHIQDAASGLYAVGAGCFGIEIDTLGGGQVGPPAMPASGIALVNPYHVAATIYLTGGAVNNVAIGGILTGITQGSFRLPAGQSILVNYSVPPSWVWMAD